MQFPIGSFIAVLIFNVAVPLLDMSNDASLLVSTLQFQGNSLDMAGCRSCYSSSANYNSKDYLQKQSCYDVCASGLATFGGIECGTLSFALDMMAQMLNSQTCLENTTWSIPNYHGAQPIQQRACKQNDSCCLTSTTKTAAVTMTAETGRVNRASDMNNLPNSTNWWACTMMHNGTCELCMGGGAGDNTACNRMYNDDKHLQDNVVKPCKSGYYGASHDTQHFEEQEECTALSECCVRIANYQVNPSNDGRRDYQRCNGVCQLHINYISMYSHNIYNWETWHDQMDFVGGILIGGRLCRLKLRTGLCLLFPIMLHWIFIFKYWWGDFREGKTTRMTFVFGATMTYPIFVALKNFFMNYKNPLEMALHKERFQREIGMIEGILEGLPQVGSQSFTVIMKYVHKYM